ncbi:MAG: sugar ABC transporter permease [Spirochaetes bacterium]|nr:sugar ABC transporter permease [Spirochaetota bacterium]
MSVAKMLLPYLYVFPFLLIMGAIFVGGLAQAIMQSLGYLPVFGMYELTFQYYLQVLQSSRFTNALSYTLYIALLSSFLSVLLGVIVAFAVQKSRMGDKLHFSLYKIPIIMPHIIVVILIFNIFFQTGTLSRMAFALGIIDNPHNFPLLVNDRAGIGIILVYLYKQVPFVALMVFAALRSLNSTYIQVAQNLGASARQTLFRVTLPMLAPSILSAFLITFAFAFGAFEVPFLMGSPARHTLPVLAYIDYSSPVHGTRPPAMAMSVIISFISLCLIGLYACLLTRLSKLGLEGRAF